MYSLLNQPANAKKQQHSKTAQTGVTLIELMVAMAVSSFILLGISNIYVSTKKAYVIHDEFARIQENGRFAMETLSSNIRNAGFFGCASGQGLGTITNGLDPTDTNKAVWNFETGLMGYDADGTAIGETKVITMSTTGRAQTDWKTAAGLQSGGSAISVNPDTTVTGLALPGSDILVIRTSAGSGINIAKNNAGAQFFAINPTGENESNNCISGVCDDDIVMVSDCSKALIFQVTNVTNVGNAVCPGLPTGAKCMNLVHSASNAVIPGNASPTWNASNQFGSGAELITMRTKTYFVGVASSGGDPSLYVRINGQTPTPLIEGIENMQILYGVDTDVTPDGIANKYVSADAASDLDLDGDPNTVFDAVVSVKISLLVRTPNNLPGVNRDLTANSNLKYKMGSPVSPIIIDPIADDSSNADRHMRKIYTMTIKIRNKSFNTAI